MGGQHSSVAPKCHGSIIRAFLRKPEPLLLQTNTILVLADSSIFRGLAIADTSSRCGEIVFNTSMTGYQEILTALSSLFEASPNLHDMKNPFGRFVMAIKEKQEK